MRIPIPNWLYNRLFSRAAARPYFHLDGYMRRYWLFGGSARDDRHDAELGWKRTRLDRWIGRFIAARVHITTRSDDGRHLHCHPWWNISVILGGEYMERLPADQRQQPHNDEEHFVERKRTPGDVVFRRARTRHRLLLADNSAVVSLFIMGPKRRGWGFHTPHGFVPWWQYSKYLASCQQRRVRRKELE